MTPVERFGKGDEPKKKAKRGSTNNKRRLDAFKAGRSDAEASWDGCDCKWLQAMVVSITSLGGAVTIGLSRDMGAYSVTLLLDGQRETLWFNGSADLDDELKTIVGNLDALT